MQEGVIIKISGKDITGILMCLSIPTERFSIGKISYAKNVRMNLNQFDSFKHNGHQVDNVFIETEYNSIDISRKEGLLALLKAYNYFETKQQWEKINHFCEETENVYEIALKASQIRILPSVKSLYEGDDRFNPKKIIALSLIEIADLDDYVCETMLTILFRLYAEYLTSNSSMGFKRYTYLKSLFAETQDFYFKSQYELTGCIKVDLIKALIYFSGLQL